MSRIPTNIVRLAEEVPSVTATSVLAGLQGGAAHPWAAVAQRAVVAGILRDVFDNRTFDGLMPGNVADLHGIVAFSADLASRTLDVISIGVFGVLATNLVTDWVDSWNDRQAGENDDGPYDRAKYGRLPRTTAKVCERSVACAQAIAEAGLSYGIASPYYRSAVYAVADVLLRDYRENGNGADAEEPLRSVDQSDLASFVRTAETAAEGVGQSISMRLETFEPVLAALLKDWLDNWNVDGREGAPADENGY